MRNEMYKDLYGEGYGEKWYSIIPIAFLVCIVPLIVYGKMNQLTGDYYKYWNGSSSSFDFFSYYKLIWFMVSVAIALIILGIKVYSKDIKIQKRIIYIPMAIYSILVILSAVFSQYSGIPIWGFVERYEGLLAILSYMLILFIVINMVTNKKQIKVILIALICSAVILGIIGMLQYFNHDFFKTTTGKSLILPRQYQNMVQKLKFQFGDKIIYGTLYHYNYVGSYMAMLFPLTFTMFLFIKNKFYKITMGVVSILMFLNLMLCHSRAGIIGGFISVVVLLIFIRKTVMKNYKYFIGAVAIALVALVGFNIYSKGMLSNRISSLFTDAESVTKSTNNNEIKDITTNNNELKIITLNNTLKIVSNNGKLEFKDDSDTLIKNDINKSNGQVTLKNDKYKEYTMNVTSEDASSGRSEIKINKSGIEMTFLDYNNKFSLLDKNGDSVDIKPVEKWGFEGKEKLGSARGYIWSRSIPLMKHTILLGYGPDTFAAKFPQNDYVGKLIAYDTTNMLVDKAHNLYLENAINIGVLGLIAFLAIFVLYIISCVKLYFKSDFNDFYSIVGLAILTAICGYLGAGFFNDSVVSVAPVFWVLLGMGISINYQLKNKDKKSKKA